MRVSFIGIMVNNTPDLVVGLLSILKSGNCFVPINPNFPERRINFVLNDCNIKILLTDKNNYNRARKISGVNNCLEHVICIHSIDFKSCKKSSFLGNKNKNKKLRESRAQNFQHKPCYVIYTSGSTGKPKGVLISHTNFVPLLLWSRDYFNLDQDIKVIQNLSYTFDFGVFEIFSTIIFGGMLYFFSKKELFGLTDYVNFINLHGINTIHATPAFFSNIVYLGEKLSTLRIIHLGGEKLTGKLVKEISKLVGSKCIIYNGYGPTETTITSSIFSLKADDANNIKDSDNIPIGKPSANNLLYILNKSNKLLPAGVTGELCISGDGLSIGYLNRPKLINERFVANPFLPGKKMYKTGDLVKWLSDGNIEFLCRIDYQVKIRGFRIELGEIENCLVKNNDIREAIVIDREEKNRDKYLCAYIVSDKKLEISRLKEHMFRELPDYMIPAYFVQLEEMPITANGKIDRKRLPEPEGAIVSTIEYVSPRNEVEERIAKIWKEILNIDRVGINDNFFESGGHSLKAIKFISAIHKELNVKLSVIDLFQSPTIALLYNLIKNCETTNYKEIEKIPEREYYELSYSQERLWILYKLDLKNTAFNMGGKITLKEHVDKNIIINVFEKLIRRHESFRTYFKKIENKPVQVILPDAQMNLEVIDLSLLDEEELERERIRHFNDESRLPFTLEIAPLLRAKLIKCKENEYDLLVTMHHIISDGWSIEIVEQEFYSIYDSIKKGKSDNLVPLRIQYKDYAAWHNRVLSNKKKMQAAREFWKTQLSGVPSLLELPYDFSRKNLNSKESAGFIIVIPGEVIHRLREIARENNASLFMVLLAGFNLLLSLKSRQDDIMVAFPGAARQHEDLKNIIGFFVNTLILRNRVIPDESFIDFLGRVQKNTLQVLEYQSYPLELICSELKMKYPEISVFFNMITFGNKNQKYLQDMESRHIEQVQNAKFDIVCYLTEYKNGLKIGTHYYKKVFKAEKIEDLMKLYIKILEEISIEPYKEVRAYSMPKRSLSIQLN